MNKGLKYFLLTVEFVFFCAFSSDIYSSVTSEFTELSCPECGHVQGVTADENYLYFSLSRCVVKVDKNSHTVLASSDPTWVQSKYCNLGGLFHHGDLDYYGGYLWVAVEDLIGGECISVGSFVDTNKRCSLVFIYDTDLNLVSKINLSDGQPSNASPARGAGAIAISDAGEMAVAGGASAAHKYNLVYRYKVSIPEEINMASRPQVRYIGTKAIQSGPTNLGIQSIEYAGEKWWFGTFTFLDTYPLELAPKAPNNYRLLVADKNFRFCLGSGETPLHNFPYGIHHKSNGTFYRANKSSFSVEAINLSELYEDGCSHRRVPLREKNIILNSYYIN